MSNYPHKRRTHYHYAAENRPDNRKKVNCLNKSIVCTVCIWINTVTVRMIEINTPVFLTTMLLTQKAGTCISSCTLHCLPVRNVMFIILQAFIKSFHSLFITINNLLMKMEPLCIPDRQSSGETVEGIKAL